MVLEYGMGKTLGPVTFPRQRHPIFLGANTAGWPDGTREYSEATAQALDEETKTILDARMEHVVDILSGKRDLLGKISALLLEKEVIDSDEFERLIGVEERTQTTVVQESA
jgi:cell division protease FtsH